MKKYSINLQEVQTADINQTIETVGKIIAMKALKTTYANSGLEMYRPRPDSDMHQEFTDIAYLALAETMQKFPCSQCGLLALALTCHEKETVGPAYKAINAFVYSNRKDTSNCLYSDRITDEEGNTIELLENAVIDQTTRLQGAKFRLAAELQRHLTASEWKVLKYLTLGYTTETIQKRMEYKTKASTLRKIQATRQSAARVLRDTCGIEAGISDRTKTRRRQKVRSAK